MLLLSYGRRIIFDNDTIRFGIKRSKT